MEYKLGDKVRIKGLGWYNENKDEDGFVYCGDRVFDDYMSVFCESVVTIGGIYTTGYAIREDRQCRIWTDDMIDCLVERNGKTYPYKIGDRVILKGNNRCATITDLKYNSWGNLSYYIKIDNDKDISIDYPTELLLPYNNMIEGLVEETKPEFNIGDKITDGKTHLTILNIISDKYIVEDNFGKCGTLYFNSQDYWKLVEEETKPKYEDEVNGEYYSTPKHLVRPSGYQFVDENGNIINAQKIVLKKLVVPKFKKGDKIKDKNNRVWYVVQVGDKHFDISRIPNCSCNGSGYFVPMEDQDDYELAPDRELPKTFEECVSVLMCEGGNRMPLELMNTFRKLIDARNAYWTIYGEENGLGKPWEPDWDNLSTNHEFIKINKGCFTYSSRVLVFPTEEMRDAFYENFKSEIESCKEFL